MKGILGHETRPLIIHAVDEYLDLVIANVGYNRDEDDGAYEALAALMNRTDPDVLRALNVH